MTMSTYGSVVTGENASNLPNGLMPSPNSTDGPSLGGGAQDGDQSNAETYQLLKNANDNGGRAGSSEIQLLQFRPKRSFDELVQEHVTGPHVRTRNLLWLMAIVVSVGLAVGFSNKFGDLTNNSNDTDSNKTSKGASNFHLSMYGPSKGTRAPLSTLDPVEDLGLYDFHRPKETRPARPVTKGLKENGKKTFPTNAWYQSLLMPGGEPDVTHRAYAIPYIVDAAGPMPGLRLHSNHIDASSFVVQLYVLEEYGLTVGATADAAVVKKTETTDVSHQYTVTHATPLGVTLDWVRQNGGSLVIEYHVLC
jgi:hypothetical protein